MPATAPDLVLRTTILSDLEVFFFNQSDEEACYMAAFTAKDPKDYPAYIAKWSVHVNDVAMPMVTILLNGDIVGSVLSYEMEGEPQVSYWIEKKYWGQGIATEALKQFIPTLSKRPLYGRIASDNIASRRVLEKCGFTIAGYEQGFANARGQEIEEIVFKLD